MNVKNKSTFAENPDTAKQMFKSNEMSVHHQFHLIANGLLFVARNFSVHF